ncbi:uncharacterized protein TEOVI_000843300 [Trypanosoma equiperdum]|uniref:Variant surface glycoprotein (VSG) n=1 Tax=Trypanosoma equiperdum TaxID=5694 RepID=A0A1G4I083_TRYEQ|nr:hypothetical protein, conserved [Trypanosoma equiperdum]
MTAVARKLAKIAFLLAFATTAQGGADEYEKCTTSCACKRRLAAATRYYAKTLETNTKKLKNLQLDMAKLAVAATSGDATAARRSTPALAAAGAIVAACANAVINQAEAIAEHLPAVAKAEQALANMIERQQRTATLKITGTGNAGRFDETSLATTPLTVTSNDQQCPTPNPDKEGSFDGEADAAKNTFDYPKEYETYTVTCASTPGNNCHTAAITSSSGYIQIKRTTSTSQEKSKPNTQWNTQGGQTDVVLTQPIEIGKAATTAATAAIAALQAAASDRSCDKQMTSKSTVTATTFFRRQAIRTLLNEPDNEKESTTPTSQLDTAVTAEYGDTDSQYKEKLWNVIETLKPAITKTNARSTLDINANTPLEQLTEALARQIDEANSKASQTTENNKKENDPSKSDAADKKEEKKEGDNKTTAAERKATEEGKCDKNKCVRDKEKNECKVKEGAVINSFVIYFLFCLQFSIIKFSKCFDNFFNFMQICHFEKILMLLNFFY